MEGLKKIIPKNLKCGTKQKYVVIKIEDIQNYFSDIKQHDLLNLLEYLSVCRKEDEKKENEYIVINTDEPYAEGVIDILKRNGHWG